jgi:hypothetical protein
MNSYYTAELKGDRNFRTQAEILELRTYTYNSCMEQTVKRTTWEKDFWKLQADTMVSVR